MSWIAALWMAPLAAAPAFGQVDLSFQDGVLGSDVGYEISGAPLAFYGLAVGITATATPLQCVPGVAPCELGVGPELQALWRVGSFDPGGTAWELFPLPADPALTGVKALAQAVQFELPTFLVAAFSPRAELILELEGGSHFACGDTLFPRRHHTSSSLPDGRVLLTGGLDPYFPGSQPFHVASAELFDPDSQSFVPSFAKLGIPRSRHTATELLDGRVLVVGGIGPGGTVLASAELYDPITDAFAPAATMAVPRVFHTATLLPGGRVLVVGGSVDYDYPHPIGFPASLAAATTKIEIYDPSSDTWLNGPVLGTGRTAHQATKLGDGSVLISGGVIFFATGSTTASCLIYDPAQMALLGAPALPQPVCFHSASPTLDGGAIVAGGGRILFASTTYQGSAATWRYTPAADTWSGAGLLPSIQGPDGRTICVCKAPIGPIGPGFPNPNGDDDDCGIQAPIVYAHGGGLIDFDLASGSSDDSSQVFVLQEAPDGGWSLGGTFVKPRTLPELMPLGGGARVLVTGAADQGDLSAELWLVDY
ncbi:MAG: kelch repeat-containing protein [Planctomycetota bacterium]